jgi:hypothetical protein
MRVCVGLLWVLDETMSYAGEEMAVRGDQVARINKHQSRRGLAGGVIESSSFETIDTINPSHPTLLTLANSISARPAPLSHTETSAKKHPSHPASSTFTTANMGLEATMIVYV